MHGTTSFQEESVVSEQFTMHLTHCLVKKNWKKILCSFKKCKHFFLGKNKSMQIIVRIAGYSTLQSSNIFSNSDIERGHIRIILESWIIFSSVSNKLQGFKIRIWFVQIIRLYANIRKNEKWSLFDFRLLWMSEFVRSFAREFSTSINFVRSFVWKILRSIKFLETTTISSCCVWNSQSHICADVLLSTRWLSISQNW